MIELIRNYFTPGEVIGTISKLPNENGFWIEVTGHKYVTLYWKNQFIGCFDNDMKYADEIIEIIEKRTRCKIEELPTNNKIEDFNGFRFLAKGFKNLITKK